MLVNRFKTILTFLIFLFISGFTSAHSNYIFKHLPGKWTKDTLPNSYIEEWERIGKRVLIGKAYKIENSDTILLEELKINYIKCRLTYTALVYNQNNGQPVSFKLCRKGCNNMFEKKSSKTYIFCNCKHDFPQEIIYSFYNKNKIEVKAITYEPLLDIYRHIYFKVK